MKTYVIAASIVLLAGVATYSSAGVGLLALIQGFAATDLDTAPTVSTGKTMRAFSSKTELVDALRRARKQRGEQSDALSNVASETVTAAPPSPAAKSSGAMSESKDEAITNNQHAGVDEGGIVKAHGDHLVILRRGRLFTVRVDGRSLETTSSINAYPPGVDPSSDWYDEMLVSADTIAVIGYSYGRGGTEINLFNIDRRGGLSYRSSYHLRSSDYYSSRNYASRLIGNKLVFYTPQYIGYSEDPASQFPAIRRWRNKVKNTDFKPVLGATEIYRAEKDPGEAIYTALHTVTVCDLASGEMTCKGTGVIGAPGRVFYVSPKHVYVWTNELTHGTSKVPDSMLYKLPLDGSAPSAVGASGAPVDQFSFLEDDTQQLNVLVRSAGNGEQMWGSEMATGKIALFKVSADEFGDGSHRAGTKNYQGLPNVSGTTFQNRFVGEHILYGTGNGWGGQNSGRGSELIATNWKSGAVTELRLDHSVDRIEQMGSAAVIVGTNGSDLYFSPIALDGIPTPRASLIRKNASQGELRSHGFFYRPESDDKGTLGLPITRARRPGYKHLTEGSASILFLKNRDLRLAAAGELAADNTSTEDGCKASCVDWYGNARPIFLKGRVFALLGYEIVEGRLDDDRIREIRRINYSPKVGSWWDRAEEE